MRDSSSTASAPNGSLPQTVATIQRTGALRSGAGSQTPQAHAASALSAGWRTGLAIVNLRGDSADPLFLAAVSSALGIELPVTPCNSTTAGATRVVWAGPDDWFVIGTGGQSHAIVAQLETALADLHHAVTDVSSGYSVLRLSGVRVREVLAQGCPLDLHPRVFQPGMSAGSHFFKTSIWLWQTDDAPSYELLVRRSFMGYVWLMVESSTWECGLVDSAGLK